MSSKKNSRGCCKQCQYSAKCMVDGRLYTLARVWKSMEDAMTAGLLPCEMQDNQCKADENLRRLTQHLRARLNGNWNRVLTREEWDAVFKEAVW